MHKNILNQIFNFFKLICIQYKISMNVTRYSFPSAVHDMYQRVMILKRQIQSVTSLIFVLQASRKKILLSTIHLLYYAGLKKKYAASSCESISMSVFTVIYSCATIGRSLPYSASTKSIKNIHQNLVCRSFD